MQALGPREQQILNEALASQPTMDETQPTIDYLLALAGVAGAGRGDSRLASALRDLGVRPLGVRKRIELALLSEVVRDASTRSHKPSLTPKG